MCDSAWELFQTRFNTKAVPSVISWVVGFYGCKRFDFSSVLSGPHVIVSAPPHIKHRFGSCQPLFFCISRVKALAQVASQAKRGVGRHTRDQIIS